MAKITVCDRCHTTIDKGYIGNEYHIEMPTMVKGDVLNRLELQYTRHEGHNNWVAREFCEPCWLLILDVANRRAHGVVNPVIADSERRIPAVVPGPAAFVVFGRKAGMAPEMFGVYSTRERAESAKPEDYEDAFGSVSFWIVEMSIDEPRKIGVKP